MQVNCLLITKATFTGIEKRGSNSGKANPDCKGPTAITPTPFSLIIVTYIVCLNMPVCAWDNSEKVLLYVIEGIRYLDTGRGGRSVGRPKQHEE